MFVFRLLAGQHIQKEKGKARTYNARQIVRSETNLAEKFGDNKFRLIRQEGAPKVKEEEETVEEEVSQEEDDNLEEMALSDLRSLASSEEINLHGATKKKEIIEIIRETRRARAESPEEEEE